MFWLLFQNALFGLAYRSHQLSQVLLISNIFSIQSLNFDILNFLNFFNKRGKPVFQIIDFTSERFFENQLVSDRSFSGSFYSVPNFRKIVINILFQ
jgi:hypothetical protein